MPANISLAEIEHIGTFNGALDQTTSETRNDPDGACPADAGVGKYPCEGGLRGVGRRHIRVNDNSL